MIRESIYFSFNDRVSTEFPIANVSLGEGLYEESMASGKSINESYPRNAFKPYLFGTQKEVKQFDFSFAFLEQYNDQMIDEVIRWLNVDDYAPLFFEANIDRVFYAMPISDINHIHNGLKEGYLTLTVRCDSAYSYSHEIITPWYDLTSEQDIIISEDFKEIDINGIEVEGSANKIRTSDMPTEQIELKNYGHYSLHPEIWMEKTHAGDIVIKNLMNNNQEFRFTNIPVGENLYIDCMNEIIETDKENTYRVDNFNDNYLEIVYGKNLLQVSQNVRIKFKYQYIFS